MGERTEIEWADHTFNPWIGCTKVSPACDSCYAAELMDTRYGRVTWGAGEDRSRTSAGNWRQPLKWDRAEWQAWADLDPDDERAWEPPAYAKPLGGGPQGITFTNPQGLL